ncbi:MAG: hypothetical protein Q8K96_06880 [Rubrivivax sp.]|nr:hypothetical protein [Rubrivivax sp.]
MKHFITKQCLIMVILMLHAVIAFSANWEEATGPYATIVVADTGPGNAYYIYRPITLSSNAHPIVVFCVGSGSHPKNYDALLIPLASHGVIVIASTDPYQSDGSKASAGVNWLIDQNGVSKSEYYQKLIPSRVLAIGHSIGANGVMLASIGNPRITSLLLYMPALDTAKSSDLLVPTFYVSGSLDNTVPPDFVRAKYQEATKANAWYGENINQSHVGFGRNPSVQYYARAWIYTHLFGDLGTARGSFYGPNWTFNNASGWSVKLKNNNAP